MCALTVKIIGKTDIGRRRHRNEDSVGFYKPTNPEKLNTYGYILVVADGVGGNANGDKASKLATTNIIQFYYSQSENISPDKRLKKAIEKTNDIILRKARDYGTPGMATTVTAAVIIGNVAYVANVGDSRTYIINPKRKKKIQQITMDHSLVAEQVRKGLLTVKEAENAPNKNVITRALGMDSDVKVDLFRVPLIPGDRLLLCSDGLVKVVKDFEILQIVSSNSPENAVNRLIDLANQRGGPDNITICLASVENAPVPVAAIIVPIAAALIGLILLFTVPVFSIGNSNVSKISPSPPPKTGFTQLAADSSGTVYVSNGKEIYKLSDNKLTLYNPEVKNNSSQNNSGNILLVKNAPQSENPWVTQKGISACYPKSGNCYYIDSSGKLYSYSSSGSEPIGSGKKNQQLQLKWKDVIPCFGKSDQIILLSNKGELYLSTSDSLQPITISYKANYPVTKTSTSTDNNSPTKIKFFSAPNTSYAFAVTDDGKLVCGELSTNTNSKLPKFTIERILGKIVKTNVTKVSLFKKIKSGSGSGNKQNKSPSIPNIGIEKGINSIKGMLAVEEQNQLEGSEMAYDIYFLTSKNLYKYSVECPSSKSPAADTSTLSVSSVPQGAEIYIDGKDTGKQTPQQSITLTPGTHTLKLAKQGYIPFAGPFTTEEGKTKTINATLKKKPENTNSTTNNKPTKPAVHYALLFITSSPSNAKVYINNSYIGTTPINNYKLKQGTYTLTLKKDNYKTYTKTITITSSTNTVPIPVILTPSQNTKPVPKGSLSITSDPEGAEIYLQRLSPKKWKSLEDKKLKTPATFKNVNPGDVYLIVLKKEGYKGWSIKVTIQSGKTTTVNANLEQITATLSITSTPSKAKVFIDEKQKGFTPLNNLTLNYGEHIIKITKVGYQDYKITVNVTANSPANMEVNVTLESIYGTIKIEVPNILKNADVLIDGKATNNKSPCTLNKVKIGLHTITFKKEGYIDYYKISVEVKSGEKTLIDQNNFGFIKFIAQDSKSPKDVKISINGEKLKYKGKELITLPITVIVRPNQTYGIDISKEGYEEKSLKSVPVGQNETKTIQVNLQKSSLGSSTSFSVQSCSNQSLLAILFSYSHSIRLSVLRKFSIKKIFDFFTIPTAYASDTFTFHKKVNIADVSQPIDISTFHTVVSFSGNLDISGDCEIQPSFSSKRINPNDTTSLALTPQSSSFTVLLTLYVSALGNRYTKEFKATLPSIFSTQLDLGSTRISPGGPGNPTITIHPVLVLSQPTLTCGIKTVGSVKADRNTITFTDDLPKTITVSSSGSGNSSLFLTSPSLNANIDSLAISGEASVSLPFLGKESVSLGTISLPVSSSIDISGSPSSLKIVQFSDTSIPSHNNASPPTGAAGESGGGAPLSGKQAMVILLSAASGGFVILLILLLRNNSSKKSSTSLSNYAIVSSKGVYGLNPRMGRVTIGRAPNNNIVVSTPYASKYHAALLFQNGRWFVRDYSSKNGTFVNDRRINGITELHVGDEIKIGRERLQFIANSGEGYPNYPHIDNYRQNYHGGV